MLIWSVSGEDSPQLVDNHLLAMSSHGLSLEHVCGGENKLSDLLLIRSFILSDQTLAF